MAVDFEFKSKYNVDDLLSIMRILREPGGCPWDMEQTHESIKKNFIEETYEVVEAIDKKDKELLCEELGDVLMQVVFHAEMERENGSFDFSDVADGVCKKLIERHPHVFGDTEVSSTDEVLSNWDAIKSKSKKRKTVTWSRSTAFCKRPKSPSQERKLSRQLLRAKYSSSTSPIRLEPREARMTKEPSLTA